jgi:hypothetical protein
MAREGGRHENAHGKLRLIIDATVRSRAAYVQLKKYLWQTI